VGLVHLPLVNITVMSVPLAYVSDVCVVSQDGSNAMSVGGFGPPPASQHFSQPPPSFGHPPPPLPTATAPATGQFDYSQHGLLLSAA